MKDITYYKLALVSLLVGLAFHMFYTQLHADLIFEAIGSLFFIASFVSLGVYMWKFWHPKEATDAKA